MRESPYLYFDDAVQLGLELVLADLVLLQLHHELVVAFPEVELLAGFELGHAHFPEFGLEELEFLGVGASLQFP